jgi:hypothetical protein
VNVSDFAEQYAAMVDDQILCLWAERATLVPDAALALDVEIQKRGLNKENASRVKKRLNELAAREGSLRQQVAAAKYERSMRHFIGWEEPQFYSPYGGRDIRNIFAYVRHKYTVWKAFRDHTGRLPLLSIWFYFLSWTVIFALSAAIIAWVSGRKWGNLPSFAAIGTCVLVLIGTQKLGARLMRKLDWKRCNK